MASVAGSVAIREKVLLPCFNNQKQMPTSSETSSSSESSSSSNSSPHRLLSQEESAQLRLEIMERLSKLGPADRAAFEQQMVDKIAKDVEGANRAGGSTNSQVEQGAVSVGGKGVVDSEGYPVVTGEGDHLRPGEKLDDSHLAKAEALAAAKEAVSQFLVEFKNYASTADLAEVRELAGTLREVGAISNVMDKLDGGGGGNYWSEVREAVEAVPEIASRVSHEKLETVIKLADAIDALKETNEVIGKVIEDGDKVSAAESLKSISESDAVKQNPDLSTQVDKVSAILAQEGPLSASDVSELKNSVERVVVQTNLTQESFQWSSEKLKNTISEITEEVAQSKTQIVEKLLDKVSGEGITPFQAEARLIVIEGLDAREKTQEREQGASGSGTLPPGGKSNSSSGPAELSPEVGKLPSGQVSNLDSVRDMLRPDSNSYSDQDLKSVLTLDFINEIADKGLPEKAVEVVEGVLREKAVEQGFDPEAVDKVIATAVLGDVEGAKGDVHLNVDLNSGASEPTAEFDDRVLNIDAQEIRERLENEFTGSNRESTDKVAEADIEMEMSAE